MATLYPTAAQARAAAAPATVAPLSSDPAAHLLCRFTFGSTPQDRASALPADPDAWWSDQVAKANTAVAAGYSQVPAIGALGPLLGQSPAQVRAWLKAQGREYDWDALDQLTLVTLGLQLWSPAQLFETLVDFFSNHLNVANHQGDTWNTRHVYDRDVIRRYATGTFEQMLLASAKSPAMLLFLNQAESTKTAVNENYGRELLELHTVGLTYSESDVRNSAYVLTGRCVDDDASTYTYRPEVHYTGPVAILGFTAPNPDAAGGEATQDAYLSYLAHHPNTANHLARKLCVRFVSDNPSDSLVSEVAAVYLANDTGIIPTVYAILRSDEFWSARGQKVRRPAENAVASGRALGLQPASGVAEVLNDLHWTLYTINNSVLDAVPPTGYPDVAAAWRSASGLLTTWMIHRAFAQNWWSGLSKFDPLTFFGSTPPTTSGAALDLLSQHVLGRTLAPADRSAMLTYSGDADGTTYASSGLQWRLSGAVALLLDSPYHALR